MSARLFALASMLAATTAGGEIPAELTVRARVTRLTPDVPVRILWRWGGEAQGGAVVRGELTAELPRRPAPALPGDAGPDLPEIGDEKPADRVIVEGKTHRYHYLRRGTWSRAVPVASFRRRGLSFVTFSLLPLEGKKTKLTGVELEFEFRFRDKLVEALREAGPDGPTAGLVIPLHLLQEGQSPTSAEFRDGLMGLFEYARRRADRLEKLPWTQRPLPRLFGILTDCSGYGAGAGYGIRHTNKAIIESELRTLRQLGVNGLRGAPAFLLDRVDRREGTAAAFGRIRELHGMGYPVPAVRRAERSGRIVRAPEGAGCPYHPDVAARTREGVRETLDKCLKLNVDEAWALTVDEIGSVFDRAPEGKGHQSICPRCIEGFRAYVKELGYGLDDFGAKDWSQIRPNVYAPQGQSLGDPWLGEPGWSLLKYCSRRFNCAASARLFTPLRDACAKADSAGRRPRVYSFALRGNTFLMRGHSLDFFHFYRHADNAFVYETSNRDPRVWPWDSYLCDVGRVLKERMGLQFGIYVKPHRGAPIQRALAALSRGATMLFWYTYGPDYWKGDSFSGRPGVLDRVSRCARLIGAAEGVLHGGTLAHAPQVAVVRPRTSEIWGNDAAWENGKWVYAALTHAHIPVDPLDEEMLARDDLSRYKAIYVSGTHLRRDAARKLAAWAEGGGTLVTSGWGLARDEANQPLDILRPVLGLQTRADPEMWCTIRRYGATRLATFRDRKTAPEAANVVGQGALVGTYRPRVGREVLRPADGTEVLATFADGTAAITRHRHGKGQAVVIGLFAGLEYAERVHRDDFDMSADFDAGWRRLMTTFAGVAPPVDTGQPTVEGIVVRNQATGTRAVVLLNWTYRGRELVAFERLAVTVRGVGGARRARSAWSEQDLRYEASRGGLVIRLPRLDDADVLLIE